MDASRFELQELAYGEPHLATAGAVLLVTVVYDRLRWKYGDRAYRFACTDVGFLGENVYLAAEAMGLGCCALSGFAQDATESLLGVDGAREPQPPDARRQRMHNLDRRPTTAVATIDGCFTAGHVPHTSPVA